jgi:hypothetical protein
MDHFAVDFLYIDVTYLLFVSVKVVCFVVCQQLSFIAGFSLYGNTVLCLLLLEYFIVLLGVLIDILNYM